MKNIISRVLVVAIVVGFALMGYGAIMIFINRNSFDLATSAYLKCIIGYIVIFISIQILKFL